MLLSDLLSECKTSPYIDVEISDVSENSKRIRPQSLFVALNGERYDGGDFIREALENGASAVVTGRKTDDPRVITADDVDDASARIFSNFFGRPADGMTLIAVTGTNGKTSAVAELTHILDASGKNAGSLGTVGFTVNGKEIGKEEFFGSSSSMTTPGVKDLYRALAFMRDEGCSFAAVEASSHALAAKRFNGAKAALGIFTNLTPEHLDRHGDMESYFKAKESLFGLSERFLVNIDDGYGRRIFESYDSAFGYSVSESVKASRRVFHAENAVTGDGTEYDLRYEGGALHISTKVSGAFALYNSLCASSAALLLGVDPADISRAVCSFPGVKGRMERIAGGDGTPTVIIDYAHTPDAIEKAILEARAYCSGKLIVVFGCGGDRDREKRAPMRKAACRLADLVIITGDNPRSEDPDGIISDILEGASENNYEVEKDRKTALELAIELSECGDVVLCCGKGHENYIIDKRGKRPFDEKGILISAVNRKFGAL